MVIIVCILHVLTFYFFNLGAAYHLAARECDSILQLAC